MIHESNRGNERPGNWSCDLRASERPQNKLHFEGTTFNIKHTDIATLWLTRPRGPSQCKNSFLLKFLKVGAGVKPNSPFGLLERGWCLSHFWMTFLIIWCLFNIKCSCILLGALGLGEPENIIYSPTQHLILYCTALHYVFNTAQF